MGYALDLEAADRFLAELSKDYYIFAPKVWAGQGPFSDTDRIGYGLITSLKEVEFSLKSEFTFKEALTPLSQTLFYYTENQVKEPDPLPKGIVLFVRACDLHAIKRQDEIYLANGPADYYYEARRRQTKFILMGCPQSFSTCFCVDMGANQADNYDAYVEIKDGRALVDNRLPDWEPLWQDQASQSLEVKPAFVRANQVRVDLPEQLSVHIMKSGQWAEYDSRCIACGRCNFSCPTCTCFTMQDIYYTDNGQAGERRRVAASCMVDGFTEVAGGGSYRLSHGQRMRFKVLHKVHDFKHGFGYQMCVGCGRCDDVCPEYISFPHILNKLAAMMKEVEGAK